MPPYAEYFCRNQGALTPEQQQTLHQSRVMVVGCGGLGGYVIEQLVRIGVGQLDIFDPDAFVASNCNRQLNALGSTLGSTLGLNKAAVAAERAAAIHPFSRVSAHASDFRAVGGDHPFRAEVVVDCLDNARARHDLAALCTTHNCPLVHGAVNGWCGQVGVQLAGGDLIARLYPPRSSDPVADPAAEPPPVLSFVVAAIASLQAAETVKLLLHLPSTLHNQWLHLDLKHGDLLQAP